MIYKWMNDEMDVQISINVKDENNGKERLLTALEEIKKKLVNEINFPDEKKSLDEMNSLEKINSLEKMNSLENINSQDVINSLDKISSHNKFNPLEERVVRLLKEKNFTLTAAESCTGGLFMSHIVNVSGASDVIKQGYVTYSEEAKVNLIGVRRKTLDTFGVVSEEIAREMASGAAKNAHAEVAIGITGVAGPSGGTTKTPVGTVCIGLHIKNKVFSKRFIFNGNRESIREQSVISALEFIHEKLIDRWI